MKKYQLLCCSMGALVIGLLLSAYMSGFLIFFVSRTSLIPEKKEITTQQKLLYSWSGQKWQTEVVTLVWDESAERTIKNLANKWFSLLYQERKIDKKVVVQSVLIARGCAYISCDYYPFLKEWSIYTKIRMIEGLLKTIQKADVGVQKVQFLVQHQIMHDPHLDFSRPWPVIGFL
ncbi:MAG TPA: hypothetical protein VEK38_00355 [Candidatus Bathyarchaeia archaeon]|nr:hypothetical protein [Candidatus Bathyarchaeia archaeon]